MNPWDDRDLEGFDAIDDALRTVELAPAPPDLAQSVMRRVRSETLLPLPRFRLAWIDYALSLFAAGMIGLIVLLSRTLPPEMELYLRLEAAYWIESAALDPAAPFYLAGAAFLLVTGAAALAYFSMRLFWKKNPSGSKA